jgi:hypothetical protein
VVLELKDKNDMKPSLFAFWMLALSPLTAWSEPAQVLVWPQSETFYDSKAATQSRRMVEPAAVANTYAYPVQGGTLAAPAMMPAPQYAPPSQMGYRPAPSQLQGFPNSPSGFIPQMPQGMPQGFPTSLPSFSAPTVTVPSMPSMMPNYGNMPFSPMPSMGSMPFNSGNFPSGGFGNMMPFPGGNGFSGMPFGFGY